MKRQAGFCQEQNQIRELLVKILFSSVSTRTKFSPLLRPHHDVVQRQWTWSPTHF